MTSEAVDCKQRRYNLKMRCYSLSKTRFKGVRVKLKSLVLSIVWRHLLAVVDAYMISIIKRQNIQCFQRTLQGPTLHNDNHSRVPIAHWITHWRREREVPRSSPVGRICFVGCY